MMPSRLTQHKRWTLLLGLKSEASLLYNDASATVTDQHHPSCGLEDLDLSSEGHLDSAVSLRVCLNSGRTCMLHRKVGRKFEQRPFLL